MVPEFANEPLTDFAQSAPERQAMDAALRHVKGEFDRQWPLVIGGQRVTTTAWIESHNPCHKQQIVRPKPSEHSMPPGTLSPTGPRGCRLNELACC